MISTGSALPIAASFVGVAAPAASIVAPDPLWTPIVRVAVAIELVWIGGGLVALWWLTRCSVTEQSLPKTPEKIAPERDPPLAA